MNKKGQLDDLNPWGMVGAALGVAILFFTRKSMLGTFLAYYGLFGKLFWGGLTYLGTGFAGYLIFSKFSS